MLFNGLVMVLILAAPSRDALVGLRLRRPARRLAERTTDRPPRQLDLEVVVAEAARAAEQGVCGTGEILRRRRPALELAFGLAVAPRLVGDAAERDAGLLDGGAVEV